MKPTFSRDLKNENLDDYFSETMSAVWDIEFPKRVLTVSIIRSTPEGYEYSEPLVKYVAKWSPFR